MIMSVTPSYLHLPFAPSVRRRWLYKLRLLLVRAGCQAVLVGSSSLALWDVARQKRTAKLTGHTVRPAMQRSSAGPA